MPVTKSAQKAVRQTRTRRIINKIKKVALAKQISIIKRRSGKQSGKEISLLYSLADRAAKVGIIHPKKAARIKSKLTKKLS